METKELQEKTETELQRLLADARERVRMLRFGIAAKQVKNIREIRASRKTIAQVLTILSQQKKAKK